MIKFVIEYIDKIKKNKSLTNDEKYEIIEELEADLKRFELWKNIEINYDNC